MYLSGSPKSKAEAARWIRKGLELTVICPRTMRPIEQKEGPVTVIGPGWSGNAVLRGGIVIELR